MTAFSQSVKYVSILNTHTFPFLCMDECISVGELFRDYLMKISTRRRYGIYFWVFDHFPSE